jgi:hypothetical protein
LTGLGLAVLAEFYFDDPRGAISSVGLGLGFLLIFLVDFGIGRHRLRWWPIVPGGVLLLAGLGMASSYPGVLGQVSAWWPVLLILAGVALLLAVARRRTS